MEFLQNLIQGLSLGSVYAIIALGYTMVYGIAKMLNFAHGDVIMVGAMISFIFVQRYSEALGAFTPVAGLLIAMAVCTVLGMTIERLAYKPLRQATSLSVLITAIGMSFLLQNVAQLLWTANTKTPSALIQLDAIRLAGDSLTISWDTMLTIVANIVIMLTLTWFTSATKTGRAMRAVSEDKGAAQLMGINVNRTISLTFAIGSALAAVAGVLYGAYSHCLTPTTGSMPGINAFAAAVFGGIGSIPGAMLGGLLMGVIEILSNTYINTQLGNTFVFIVLIIVLLVKPAGLLGKQVREKV